MCVCVFTHRCSTPTSAPPPLTGGLSYDLLLELAGFPILQCTYRENNGMSRP